MPRSSGDVSVRVIGELNGAAAMVDADGGAAKGAVSFRYYQAVDYQIVLPAGFHPASVQVTLRDSRSNGSRGHAEFSLEGRCSTVSPGRRRASTS